MPGLLQETGLTRLVFLFLTLAMTNVCFGAPQTNVIGWSDNFANYTNQTPLIDGTNGWYASLAECIVSQGIGIAGSQAAVVPTDVTLSNRFNNVYTRVVSLDMYVQPQMYNGTNYSNLAMSSDAAAQFFVNSNGYFMIGNGTNWIEARTMFNGTPAIAITNSNYTRVQVNLRYKNHTWNLKAWSNNTLVASTHYVNFTSNLNTFSGFNVYNGNATSFVDEVSVITGRQSLVNGVPFDTIKKMNGAFPPAAVNGVND